MTAQIVGTRGLQPVIPASTVQQIQWATAAGTADNITGAYATPNVALTDGLILGVRASAANPTTTPQFSPDGLTAAVITKNGGAALSVGDIPGALAETLLRYNLAHTRWELLNPARAAQSASPISDKTGTYAVVNGDTGLVINLGGNASYTVSFSGPGNYSSNFYVTLFNSDPVRTGRAKLITIPEIVAFYLYPQQSVKVAIDAGPHFKLIGLPARYYCPGGFICYVDVAAGNNSNDGLAGGTGNAFATIQHALTFIKASVDLAGTAGVVQLAAGTYNENVNIASEFTGNHVVSIIGDISAPQNYILTCPSAAAPIVNVDDYCTVLFTGLELTKVAVGAIGVRIGQHATADFNNCVYGSFDGGVVLQPAALARSNITGNCTIAGNFVYFAQVLQGSGFEFGGVTISIPNALSFTAFVQVVGSGSSVTCDAGLTFTGTGSAAGSAGLKHDVQINGSLIKNGATLPGATAGTTASGGQAV